MTFKHKCRNMSEKHLDWSTPMTLGMVQLHVCVCVAMLVPTTCILYTHNNSFGTGTKNVAKEMKKITEGRVKERGKKWFPDLADKSKDVCSSVLST